VLSQAPEAAALGVLEDPAPTATLPREAATQEAVARAA